MKQQIKEDELIQKQELEAKKNVINEAEERARHLRDDEVDDSEVVDQIFGFLPGSENAQGKAPKAFGDLAVSGQQYIFSEREPQSLEKTEDLSDYTFQKFSTTYFQGQNTLQHISHKLDRSLLLHEDESDNMVEFRFHFLFLRDNMFDIIYPEACSEPSQISKMESFGKVVIGFYALSIFAKRATLEV